MRGPVDDDDEANCRFVRVPVMCRRRQYYLFVRRMRDDDREDTRTRFGKNELVAVGAVIVRIVAAARPLREYCKWKMRWCAHVVSSLPRTTPPLHYANACVCESAISRVFATIAPYALRRTRTRDRE